jgi:hypothetical protein
MSRQATIVAGDPGQFTTEVEEKIRLAYGCEKVRRDWTQEGEILPGDLVLTYDKAVLTRAGRVRGRFGFSLRVVTYTVAMEMVKIDEEARAGIRD